MLRKELSKDRQEQSDRKMWKLEKARRDCSRRIKLLKAERERKRKGNSRKDWLKIRRIKSPKNEIR